MEVQGRMNTGWMNGIKNEWLNGWKSEWLNGLDELTDRRKNE